jgi:hypothetical protein
VPGKLLTPFDLAQLVGTADKIQQRLLEAAREIEEMTAAHDAAILKDDLLVRILRLRKNSKENLR